MKTQTAVEWLIEQINNKLLVSGWCDSQLTISISKDIINQAKEIEKKQIIIAYQSERYPCSDADANQYYTDTYESNI